MTAVGTQLSIHLQSGFSIVNFFSYFTNLSNLLAAGVFLYGARRSLQGPRASGADDLFRAVSVLNMAIVGVVFSALLRNTDLGSLRPWVNIAVHFVMPCAVTLDWIFQPPVRKLGLHHLLLAQILPALYLAYTLIRGANTSWYPYPFLDPSKAGGATGVAAYSAAIFITFLVAGWALFALGNKLRNKALER